MRAKTLRLNALQAIFGDRLYIFDQPNNFTKSAESIFSHVPVPSFQLSVFPQFSQFLSIGELPPELKDLRQLEAGLRANPPTQGQPPD